MNRWIRQVTTLVWGRSLEFLRDRATLGWNMAFPVLLIVVYVFAFSQDTTQFRVAVKSDFDQLGGGVYSFLNTLFIRTVPVQSLDTALAELSRHELDMVLLPDSAEYWVNQHSANSYLLDKLLAQSFGVSGVRLQRHVLAVQSVRYVDWALPGVLAMNMMFASLWGLGFAIIRYRKNGVLKRMSATPISAAQFLLAQLLSRLWVMLATTIVVYSALQAFFDFPMRGSYSVLLLATVLGATAMLGLGLVIAARTHSEELGSGLVNMICWPLLLVSEVWFSMAGAAAPLQWLMQISPLAHLIQAARSIMLDGAGMVDIASHLLYLAFFAATMLAYGAWRFRWQ